MSTDFSRIIPWPTFMQWHDLLVAGALMLVLEGILPVINPSLFKQVMLEMSRMEDKQIRNFGIVSMVLGTLFIYLLKN